MHVMDRKRRIRVVDILPDGIAEQRDHAERERRKIEVCPIEG